MRLLSFDLFEKVQPEWFKKNPNFYLSKAQRELKDWKSRQNEKDNSIKDYTNQLKKLNADDIEFSYNEDQKEYMPTKPEYLISNQFREFSQDISCSFKVKDENNYKIILALIKYLKKDTISLGNIGKEIINPLFKEITDYYALYHQYNTLFLTKDRESYKNKISELRKKGNKIYYFNNKTKGREFTDIELLEISKLKNQLKSLTIDDIYFVKTSKDKDHYHDTYSVRFKDKELNSKMYLYGLIYPGFFSKEGNENNKVYFGHLRNRYHTGSISQEIQGIGLGYKIYKAFLKFNGYMVSDQQTSMGARKIYLNMLKDDDILHIIDKKGNIKKGDEDYAYANDSAKIMLIWKDYPKMEQLLRIVKTHELRNKRHYEYDKRLLPYIKNITKNTV